MRKTLKISLLLISLIFLLIIAYPLISYLLWQKTFQSDVSQMTCTSNISEDIELSEKFEDFVLSDEDVAYVELSPSEVVTLLKDTEILEGVDIRDVCAVPSKGSWTLYTSVSFYNLTIPWTRMDIVKDNMETAQLYVKDIYIGESKLPEKLSLDIKNKLNKGMSDALILVNENNLIGRVIKNIELLDNKIVVKGASQ